MKVDMDCNICRPELHPRECHGRDGSHRQCGEHRLATTCHVRLFNGKNIMGTSMDPPRCGLPVVDHGLCEQHLADRVRLGGGGK